MVQRFALAPMDTMMRVFTWICLAIPLVIATGAVTAPRPISFALVAVAGFVVAIYAFVYLWMRPQSFVVDDRELTIEWPLRRRTIPLDQLTGARELSKAELRDQLGRIIRVGAGGLWGGFGLAWTGRGTHELWVSRTDRIVVVDGVGRRPLLITPERALEFIAAVGGARTP